MSDTSLSTHPSRPRTQPPAVPHSSASPPRPSHAARPHRSHRSHRSHRHSRHSRPRHLRVAPRRSDAPLSLTHSLPHSHRTSSSATQSAAAQELSEIATFFSTLMPVLRAPRARALPPLPRSRSEYSDLRRTDARRVPRSVSFAEQLTSVQRLSEEKEADVTPNKHDGLLSPCTSADEQESTRSQSSELDQETQSTDLTCVKKSTSFNSLLVDHVLKMCSSAFDHTNTAQP